MTTLYIVQSEEGSGIPGTPEVYTDRAEAEAAYDERWREALEPGARYTDEGYKRTPEEVKAEVDKIMADDDFEYDSWPEDGGVRMWVVEL